MVPRSGGGGIVVWLADRVGIVFAKTNFPERIVMGNIEAILCKACICRLL